MTNVRITRLYIDRGVTAIKCPFCNYTIYGISMIDLSAKKDVVLCVSCGRTYRIRKFHIELECLKNGKK